MVANDGNCLMIDIDDRRFRNSRGCSEEISGTLLSIQVNILLGYILSAGYEGVLRIGHGKK